MNEWMKEMERSSLAHTLKGDGKNNQDQRHMNDGWKMDEMNLKRTMECKIWIACQDQIYERMMEECRIMYG